MGRIGGRSMETRGWCRRRAWLPALVVCVVLAHTESNEAVTRLDSSSRDSITPLELGNRVRVDTARSRDKVSMRAKPVVDSDLDVDIGESSGIQGMLSDTKSPTLSHTKLSERESEKKAQAKKTLSKEIAQKQEAREMEKQVLSQEKEWKVEQQQKREEQEQKNHEKEAAERNSKAAQKEKEFKHQAKEKSSKHDE